MTQTGCLNCLVNVNKLPAVSMHLSNAVFLINIMMPVIRKQHANHYSVPKMIYRQSIMFSYYLDI